MWELIGEAFDMNSYGKADLLPASLTLLGGLVWATFVPYRQSAEYGVKPLASILRAVGVFFAMVLALELNDAGYRLVGACIGLLAVGAATSPCFVVSPPISRDEQPNGIIRFVQNAGERFIDSKFAAFIALIVGSLITLILGFNVAIWCTLALASVLLIAKIGKAHEGLNAFEFKRRGYFRFFAFLSTGLMLHAVFALTSIAKNLASLNLSDILSFVVLVAGFLFGVLF
ncbi:hypothetical protein [Rhizobium leguminosarum]|uniref:hypothetical protein n=1 Tax=Rhizobium leguminosarum TaxID=384 RepID=UPI001C90C48F|nr:hypothetical protein [Rhizobium leguminosarum]MBY2905731.1 hypothetical protein [Rhizobium leguminosarum]